jgi:hypothetical protein
VPALFEHDNLAGVPDRAVITLGGLAVVFAVVGSRGDLVESASLAFLFTFAVVSSLAFAERAGSRWLTAAGAVGSGAAALALAARLARSAPAAFALLVILALVAVFGRPWLLRHQPGGQDRPSSGS